MLSAVSYRNFYSTTEKSTFDIEMFHKSGNKKKPKNIQKYPNDEIGNNGWGSKNEL